MSENDDKGKVVSLSKRRKAHARAEDKRRADENARKFGRTRAERDADAARADQALRDFDGHKRADDGDDP